jgi:exopolysaccharide production protein ExoZ
MGYLQEATKESGGLPCLLFEAGQRTYEFRGSGSSKRLLTMEGLRGLAVLLVFGVHYHALFGLELDQHSTTFAISAFWECIGHSGVDLFFLMSGYLIYGALIRGTTPVTTFMKRRVQRIYPTFLCIFAVYLVLSAFFPGENKIPGNVWDAQRYILENLLLLPGIFDIQPIITVAWSLSYEFFFYLLLPLLVVILSVRRWSEKWRPLFFLALAAVYVAVCLQGVYPRPRLIMFLAGILLYDVLNNNWLRKKVQGFADKWGWAALVVTFAGIYGISLEPDALSFLPRFNQFSWTYREMVLFAGFSIFVYCCLNATGSLKRVFSWTPLRWLGNMSYSYYLIHGLTLKAFAMLAHRGFGASASSKALFWIGLPFGLLLTLVASTILFLLVEKRFSFSSHSSVVPRADLNLSDRSVEAVP